MLAKSMRCAVAGAVLLAAAAGGDHVHAQDATTRSLYRDAVAAYMKSGNAVQAVQPLLGKDAAVLADAVAATIREGDARINEAAALLHLEIGLAIAGISTPSSHGYLNLGSQLIDAVATTKADDGKKPGAERTAEIARVRATWYGVAGSAFLSVNDTVRARQFLAKGIKITPGSAAILTLQGTAEEIDGAITNPADVESLLSKRRAEGQRIRYFLNAERLYREALTADPDYALAQIRLGRVEFLFKNMKAAAVSLQKGSALAQEPTHRYLAAMFMGAYLQEQKDLAGARAEFERALEIAPQSQNAIVALAYVQVISGRPDQAQALVRGFLGTPNSDEGWWAFKNGTLDQAGLRWLRQRFQK